uniref:Uncharacterized protein n=1 Tax=Oryza brachyantha TaxID=4533 RepID=J3LSP1_ORYBR
MCTSWSCELHLCNEFLMSSRETDQRFHGKRPGKQHRCEMRVLQRRDYSATDALK